MRLLHYSDIENAYDRPERIGRLAGLLNVRRSARGQDSSEDGQNSDDDRAVVVGTGDNVGPGVLAMETEGRQALDFFRAVEPDVETFGNHDFDFGPDALREVVRESPQTWVSTNIDGGDGVAPGSSSTTIIERGDESVGFVGVTDPKSSVPDSLAVSEPTEIAREAAADLRDAGVDWVVALAHVRGERLAAFAETDVDAILAGHVHEVYRDRIDGTLVVRPGANGRTVWEIELGEEIDATRHEISDAPLDESVAEQLRARMEAAGIAEVVGRAPESVVRARESCFAGERRIANFVADAYRWAADTDVGFFDTRMLRDGPPLAGEVTVADLRGLAPFEVPLCVLSVSGATLRELLGQAVATDERAERSPTPEAWWGHFAGAAVVWDRRAAAVRAIRIGDDPLDSEATYTVATTRYVVGTEEFPAVDSNHVESTWGVQYDALVEYGRSVGVDAELDDRIAVE